MHFVSVPLLQMCQFLELVAPFFRNVRVATFSVGSRVEFLRTIFGAALQTSEYHDSALAKARAKEIAEHLDGKHLTLLKNYRPDPITEQKPVGHVVFARELLLLQGVIAPDCLLGVIAPDCLRRKGVPSSGFSILRQTFCCSFKGHIPPGPGRCRVKHIFGWFFSFFVFLGVKGAPHPFC